MTVAERLVLAHEDNIGHVGDRANLVALTRLTGRDQSLLKLIRVVEMVFQHPFALAGDDDHLFDA